MSIKSLIKMMMNKKCRHICKLCKYKCQCDWYREYKFMLMRKLVINIPEEELNIIKNKMYCGIYNPHIYKAIENGILLPIGHGRIIDESQIHNCGWDYINRHAKTDAPTILGADRRKND